MVEGRRRNAALNIRLTPGEVDMLQAISEHEGLSVSEVVWLFIRRTYEALPKKRTSAKGK